MSSLMLHSSLPLPTSFSPPSLQKSFCRALGSCAFSSGSFKFLKWSSFCPNLSLSHYSHNVFHLSGYNHITSSIDRSTVYWHYEWDFAFWILCAVFSIINNKYYHHNYDNDCHTHNDFRWEGTRHCPLRLCSASCDDFNSNGVCDVYENLRCESAVLIGTPYTVARVNIWLWRVLQFFSKFRS